MVGSYFILGVVCLPTDFFVCVHCVSVYEGQSVHLFLRKLPFDSGFGLLSPSITVLLYTNQNYSY